MAFGHKVRGLMVSCLIHHEVRVAGRDVCFGVWHKGRRRGGAAGEGHGREQGMGIKSVLILNYSRDKNPGPQEICRPLDQPAISGSDFLKAREWVV